MKKLSIDEAVEALKLGKLVVVPTETVYGLAADALDEDAIKKLYEIKGREKKKPVMLQVANLKMMKEFVQIVPLDALKLIEKYWPGPVSLVLKKNSKVNDIITAGGETVGVRMPSKRETLEIIMKMGRPIAVPSANISGKVSPKTVMQVEEQLEGLDIAGIVDGGNCDYGLESTIVDFTEEKPKILREGVIQKEEILNLFGK
ncbi:threonylcarbamoyl-AMP synthase [Candidatus Peregrinibacteria bacterium]|nr:threonylcarbamoyl-AMP synthase [Candidatus Peregrinibacteria bacterium]